MFTIRDIAKAIEKLEAVGEKPNMVKVEDELARVYRQLDSLSVQGYDNLDTLFGCMMWIKRLLGEDDVDG